MNYSNYIYRVLYANRLTIVFLLIIGLNSISWKYPFFIVFSPLIVAFVKISIYDASTYIESIYINEKTIKVIFFRYFSKHSIESDVNVSRINVIQSPSKAYKRFQMHVHVNDLIINQFELFDWDYNRMKSVESDLLSKQGPS